MSGVTTKSSTVALHLFCTNTVNNVQCTQNGKEIKDIGTTFNKGTVLIASNYDR